MNARTMVFNVSTSVETDKSPAAFAVLEVFESGGSIAMTVACLTSAARECNGELELHVASTGATVAVVFDERSALGNRPSIRTDPASEYAWCYRVLRVRSGCSVESRDILTEVPYGCLHRASVELKIAISTDQESPVQILDDTISRHLNQSLGILESSELGGAEYFGKGSRLLFNRIGSSGTCVGAIEVGASKGGISEALVSWSGEDLKPGDLLYFEWHQRLFSFDNESGELQESVNEMLTCSVLIATIVK